MEATEQQFALAHRRAVMVLVARFLTLVMVLAVLVAVVVFVTYQLTREPRVTRAGGIQCFSTWIEMDCGTYIMEADRTVGY